ncbi:terpenoid synthase [Hysterangium stoloniferum]|nr:terpenoid synthase [Hysterangium stoloniferum]
MVSSSKSHPISFRIPDLWAHCPYPAIKHPNADIIVTASNHWIEDNCRVVTPALRRSIWGGLSGQLAAFCYNHCSDERLRIVCDFMIVLFLLDDLSDDLVTQDTEILADVTMNAMNFPEFYRPTHTKGKEQPDMEPDSSKLTRDYWSRMAAGAGPEVQARIIENVELYLVAVHQQAQDRASSNIPSLNAYIEHRRLSSGCKPLFDIMEYSLDIQLPAHIVDHPLMITMKNCVNDFVALSNDIFSYNVEQARGDTHNIIAVMMKNYDLDLQSAIDRIGDICIKAINDYRQARAQFPSYGPEIDAQLSLFFHGLQSWMSGNLEWSFETPRYLGPQRHEIRRHRWVTLMQTSRPSTNAA